MPVPNLPISYKIRFTAPFKDGNLVSHLKNAGVQFSQFAPSTVLSNTVLWIDGRLMEMLRNSGADIEVEDQRMEIPPSTRAHEPEPEDEFLEPITLDDLNMTLPARELAKEHGIHPVELLDTLSEQPEDLSEVKFGIADVRLVIGEE